MCWLNVLLQIVAADTFDKIVNDPTKHVLITFCAAQEERCKRLAPVYEELAYKVRFMFIFNVLNFIQYVLVVSLSVNGIAHMNKVAVLRAMLVLRYVIIRNIYAFSMSPFCILVFNSVL